jgi:hypothetical protein
MTARDAPTAGLGLHTGLGVKRDERDGHRQWAGVGSNPDVWLLGQATVEGDPGGQAWASISICRTFQQSLCSNGLTEKQWPWRLGTTLERLQPLCAQYGRLWPRPQGS